MLDNILNLVKQQAVGQLLQKGLGQNEADQAAGIAGDSIINSLKEEAMGGNLGGITELLSGKAGLSDNPIIGKIMGAMGGGLQDKMGMSAEQSNGLTGDLLPGLMNQISGKFNSSAEEDAGFDLGAIANFMDDGKPGGVDDLVRNAGNMLGGLFGKK